MAVFCDRALHMLKDVQLDRRQGVLGVEGLRQTVGLVTQLVTTSSVFALLC